MLTGEFIAKLASLVSLVARLERLHLIEASSVALRVREGRGFPGADHVERELRPDNARAQAEHIHVVVLDSLPRREGIVADRRAHTRDLVRRYRSAHAAPAEEQPAIGLAPHHRLAHRLGEVRVIDRLLAVRAQVEHLVPEPSQLIDSRLLQNKPGVVAANRDAHLAPIVAAGLLGSDLRRRAWPLPPRFVACSPRAVPWSHAFAHRPVPGQRRRLWQRRPLPGLYPCPRRSVGFPSRLRRLVPHRHAALRRRPERDRRHLHQPPPRRPLRRLALPYLGRPARLAPDPAADRRRA